jgi:ligand-binding sensor domain-containing protein/two-component sensor histidine kinase
MPDGRRWIGTLGGLVEWAPGPPSPANFRVYNEDDGLNDREVYAISSDAAGNIWVGSRRGGIIRLAQSGFQTFGRNDGLSLSGSDELLETPVGGICVAALADARRPISCLDGRRFGVTVPQLPAAATAAIPSSNQSMIVDHLGDWWISSARGLFRLRGAKSRPGVATGNPDLRLLPEVESRRMLEDSRHNLWITFHKAWSFGLERWERESSHVDNFSASLPQTARERGVAALAEAPDDQLWIGLNRPGGLYRLHKGHFEEIAGAPAGNIQALYRDGANRLWIASAEAGLGRIDDAAAERITVRRYDRARGLSSNEVWCLTEDRYGRIYAGTARGVDQIDPKTDRITHYSSADGLTQGDIRAALSDRNGDLWFLSKRGLSRLRPTANVRQQPLQARITAIRVAGAQHPISDLGQSNVPVVESPWNRNSVQIDFSAIDFQAPEPLRYQFRLLGAAGDWSEPSPDATVHFSNLAPGHYRFLVRAINADGIAGPEPASFAFVIATPPWRRWWFVTGIAAIFMGLAYFGHRMRLERQLALERVRSRIATDLHDDIGASLSRIAVMSEVIKGRVGGADDESQRMLAEMAESSRALVDGMSDIVWSIDPRRDNLGDVVARLRAFGSDVLESRGIAWTCEGPSEALHQHLTPDQRRQLYLIFKEAIHNIARHSHARNVTLRIQVEDDGVRGEIQDDGRGVSSNGGDGLGMASMRRRSARLGGEFHIGAPTDGGTQATLRFPLASRKA